MPLAAGQTFERYEIERVIGRGGMGEVYRAVDQRLRRTVALKVLRADRSEVTEAAGGVQRLLREARAAAALNHPNSVAIYELGEAEGIPYIAMEYVNGASLRSYFGPTTKATIETKIGWLVDTARALSAAHKAGLIHRDVKPGNIMISEEGTVKVLDFGLAKPQRREEPGAFQTQMGQVLGTPRYMAPEQLEGEPASALTDQYALSLTAYELISGVHPGGPLAGRPAPLDTVVPSVGRDVAAVVARMMSRRADDRYASMDDVAQALRAAAAKLPPAPRLAPTLDAAPETVIAPTKRAASEPPTIAVIAVEEPASREVSLGAQQGFGATVRLAANASAAANAAVAAAAAAGVAPTANTVPLAQPMWTPPRQWPSNVPPPPRSNPQVLVVPTPPGSGPGLTSGVYATGADATGPQRPLPSPAAPRPGRGTPTIVYLAIAVFVLALVAGGVAAIFVR